MAIRQSNFTSHTCTLFPKKKIVSLIVLKKNSVKEIAKGLIGELSEGEKGFYNPKERARRFAEFEKQIMESPQKRRYFEEMKKKSVKEIKNA